MGGESLRAAAQPALVSWIPEEAEDERLELRGRSGIEGVDPFARHLGDPTRP